MDRSRWLVRICVAGLVLAALAVVAPIATANGPIVIETTEPYGTFNGIAYVEYSGYFDGPASTDYDVPFEIVAPADLSRGNGVLVIEPYHVMGTGGRDGYLTPEFLFGLRFSSAAIGWRDPAADPLGDFDADEAVEILRNFAAALREDDVARTMVGDVDNLYGLGISATNEPLLLFLDSAGADLLDFTLLVVPSWAPEAYTPNPTANKIMVFLTESDLISSGVAGMHTEAFRGSAPNYRAYEVAGGQHVADVPWTREVFQAWDIDLDGTNPLDWTPVVRALFVAGHCWARWGATPPPSVALVDAPAGEIDWVYQAEYGLELVTGIARDENGNALGGVRMPDLVLGRGQYIAFDPGSPWGLLGKWHDLKCEPLPDGSVRFPSHYWTYVRQFSLQTTTLAVQGFVLPADWWRMRSDGARSDVGRRGACVP